MTIDKEILQNKIQIANKFISTKISSLTTLQGILLKGEKNLLHIYSTNLNSFFHTSIKVDSSGAVSGVIDAKKIAEFLSFLPAGKIELEVNENKVSIVSGKTKGVFPLSTSSDFPLPPNIKESQKKVKAEVIVNNFPLLLFSASADESRPSLNGVLFQSDSSGLTLVTTDGFRLSLLKVKNEQGFPSVNIPSNFLSEIVSQAQGEKEIGFSYSEKEKTTLFSIGSSQFYSRLIQEEFPPYEKVIPSESVTTIVVDRQEMLRNVRLVSIFARDFSNVVVVEVKKQGLYFRPKGEAGQENETFQEGEFKGEEQTAAFNFKFLLDFLGKTTSKKIIIELLRPDAPAVFKLAGNPDFIHIIMPVRIQE